MEKVANSVNYLYKLDQIVINLLKELGEIELKSGQKSEHYQRSVEKLRLLLDEEISCLDESYISDEELNALIFIHSQLINNNPNFMALAITEDLDSLMFNHVYNLIITWLAKKQENSTEYVKTMLRIELYIDHLKRCRNPELKYRLSYLYPKFGEKLLFDEFNLNKCQFSDDTMIYLCEIENYEELREEFYINEFVQTLGFMLIAKKGIQNFEQLFEYLKVISYKMDNTQLNKAYCIALEKSPAHSEFIKEIIKLLKNKEKKLD